MRASLFREVLPVAMVFILFDVEAIFLYPWAYIYKDMFKISYSFGVYGFVEMLVYIAILLVGYIYLWKRARSTGLNSRGKRGFRKLVAENSNQNTKCWSSGFADGAPTQISEVIEFRGETTIVVPRKVRAKSPSAVRADKDLQFNLLSDATLRGPLSSRTAL